MSERRVAPIRRVAPKRVANLGSPPSSPNRSPETVQASIIEVPAAITSTSTPSPILPPTEQGQPGPSNPIPDVGSSTSPFSSQRARASPASIVKRAAPPSNRGLVRTREDGQRDVKKTTSCTSLPRTITELSHKSSFCYKKQSSLIPLEDALRDVRHSSLESKAERRAKFSAHTVSLEREDLTPSLVYKSVMKEIFSSLELPKEKLDTVFQILYGSEHVRIVFEQALLKKQDLEKLERLVLTLESLNG